MKTYYFELSEQEAQELLSWLTSRREEMTGEEESLDEEAPGLLPALEKLTAAIGSASKPKAKKKAKR